MRWLLIMCLTIAMSGSVVHGQSAAEPAWLGVAFIDVPRAIQIDEVIPDSPADLSGLMVGDLVYAVDGAPVMSGAHFQSMISSHAAGDEVTLYLRRFGRVLQTRAQLTAPLDAQELLQRRLVDKAAPDFSLPVISGSADGALANHRGKVVVLHFWSTGCRECTEVFAPLAALQAEHIGDLEVLAVSADSSSAVDAFLTTYKTGVAVLHDPNYTVHQAYRYNGQLPTTIVIGKDGFIRHADTTVRMRIDDIVLAAKRSLRDRPSI